MVVEERPKGNSVIFFEVKEANELRKKRKKERRKRMDGWMDATDRNISMYTKERQTERKKEKDG